MSPPYTIDAVRVWRGDAREARKLYRQFTTSFRGSFAMIRKYYGWTRPAMIAGLRLGRAIEIRP